MRKKWVGSEIKTIFLTANYSFVPNSLVNLSLSNLLAPRYFRMYRLFKTFYPVTLSHL